jgi:hypothetical protein
MPCKHGASSVSPAVTGSPVKVAVRSLDQPRGGITTIGPVEFVQSRQRTLRTNFDRARDTPAARRANHHLYFRRGGAGTATGARSSGAFVIAPANAG